NIRYGRPDASQKEIEEAAKNAGVHSFIIGLPETYDTFLSEKGTQLSGGQKQRIAIARALIQNPKILLLDEATSALDYKSEKLVQEALDVVSKGRTTVVVSHRLSAIKNADRIVFIEQGKVLEEGSHDELVKKGGNYFKMVTSMEMEDSSRESEKNDLIIEKNEKNFERALSFKNEKNFNKRFSECSSTIGVHDLEEEDLRADFYKTFMRILSISKPKWGILGAAAFCAGLYGLSQPALAA
uniref:ABC transporter domain-containing protein n=1 Tax=Megaselia scalaris TaxID=36166 RepID=T1GD89_MEGSC